MTLNDVKDVFDILKNLATALALVAGGGYFIYKVLSGYEVINVKLAVTTSRTPMPNSDRDYLNVVATFTKGDRGSVLLHDAQVRIKPHTGDPQQLAFVGVERLSIRLAVQGDLQRQEIRWGTRSQDAAFLNLTPGEETHFATYTDVPRNEPCTVEVVFLGQRPSSKRIGQWRASCVSMPRTA
jgi:hypothetical protein